MANYLVASGSRKISQLEIATNPVPAGSSSVMPLVIGDSFPITNGTTVQITPDSFLSNLVFDANETYTGTNTFSGNNTFSGTNSFNAPSTLFNNDRTSVTYQTLVQGANIEMFNFTGNDSLRIRVDNGNGVQFDDFNGASYDTFLKVDTNQGNVKINRETHFSNDVYITGSLRVQEVFYVFETASILNSSGSTIFGDTGDDTHQFSGSILLSGSLSIIDGATLDGVDLSVFSASVQTESGSFSARVTTNETDISNLQTDSGSFSTRVTTNETDISNLQTDSGSFSTRVTTNETDISNLQTDSGSFSTRVTTNETDISNLQTDSGSFSTRVTTLEGSVSGLSSDSASFSTRVTTNETDISNLQTDSGSFSTRVTNQESFSSSFNANVLAYNNSVGIVSSSQQINADSITNFDSNVLTYNNSLGVVSSSQQINADSVTNFDSNVLTYIDSLGVVSGSVVFNDVIFNPFVSTSAAISASNHFVPSDNEVYDLGTPTQRWRDLYLSGSTIDLGGLLIQRTADGNVQFIDSASQSTKSVTIDSITGSLDISGGLVVNDIVTIGTSNANARIFRVYGSGDLVQITSTNDGVGGAQIDLTHESATPADGDNLGIINFGGFDSGLNPTQYANIKALASSVSSETGELHFGTRQNSSTYNGSNMILGSNGDLNISGNVTASGAISASGELVGTSLDLRTYNDTSFPRKNYSDTLNYGNYLTGSSGGIVIPSGYLYPNAVYLFTIGNTSIFEDSDVTYFRAATTIFTGPESGSVWGTFVDVPTTTGNPTDITVGVTPHGGTGVRVKITNGPDYDGTPTTQLKVTATMISEIDM